MYTYQRSAILNGGTETRWCAANQERLVYCIFLFCISPWLKIFVAQHFVARTVDEVWRLEAPSEAATSEYIELVRSFQSCKYRDYSKLKASLSLQVCNLATSL